MDALENLPINPSRFTKAQLKSILGEQGVDFPQKKDELKKFYINLYKEHITPKVKQLRQEKKQRKTSETVTKSQSSSPQVVSKVLPMTTPVSSTSSRKSFTSKNSDSRRTQDFSTPSTPTLSSTRRSSFINPKILSSPYTGRPETPPSYIGSTPKYDTSGVDDNAFSAPKASTTEHLFDSVEVVPRPEEGLERNFFTSPLFRFLVVPFSMLAILTVVVGVLFTFQPSMLPPELQSFVQSAVDRVAWTGIDWEGLKARMSTLHFIPLDAVSSKLSVIKIPNEWSTLEYWKSFLPKFAEPQPQQAAHAAAQVANKVLRQQAGRHFCEKASPKGLTEDVLLDQATKMGWRHSISILDAFNLSKSFLPEYGIHFDETEQLYSTEQAPILPMSCRLERFVEENRISVIVIVVVVVAVVVAYIRQQKKQHEKKEVYI